MRLLLHIGTDKTGTIAIQQHLYLNRAWLDDKGIYLPQQGLGTNNGHAALFEAENAEGMRALSDELMEAERRSYRQAVLSWEGLSLYGRRRIKQLRAALPVEQRVVLVYLREQADIVQSGYLQQLKTLSHRLPLSAFESPKGLLQRLRPRRARKHPPRNYFRLLERWRCGLQPADAVDDIRNHYRRSNQLLAQHYLNESIRSVEVQKDCWSQLGPGELAKRADQREAIIAPIAEIPVHNGPLLSGWQAGESWGWWSEGDSSQLRLRIPFQQLLPQQLLEIELTHEQPVSPRQFEQVDDDRQLVFDIESIGYDLVSLNKTTEEET